MSTRYNNNNLTEYYEYKERNLYFHGDDYLINVIKNISKKSKYYIESGAYRAASSMYVATVNPNLYVFTSETNFKSFIVCQHNCKNFSNIKVYNEKSIDMLNRIINELDNNNESILFYLDGNSHNDSNVVDELNYIFKNFKNYYIIIDDFKNEYSNDFNFNRHLQYYTLDSIREFIPMESNIYFPNYNEKTSIYHPLVGWIMITNNVIDNHDNLYLIQHNLSNNIEIKVVNLDRRIDRWNTFTNNMLQYKLEYNRFSAIDGKILQMNQEIEKIFNIPDNFVGKRWQITHEWKIGVLGCALSHITLWKQLLKSNKDIYIILEDDIELCPGFDIELIYLFNNMKLQHEWDLIYLGINDDNYSEYYGDYFVCDKIMKLSKILRKHGGGTYGYCVSRKGAQKLLELVENNGVQQPIDHFMIDQFDHMQVYKTVPHLVNTNVFGENNDDTDIQNIGDVLKR